MHGRVRLTSPDTIWDGRPGDHLVIPATRHGLHAVDDCVALLTVAAVLSVYKPAGQTAYGMRHNRISSTAAKAGAAP